MSSAGGKRVLLEVGITSVEDAVSAHAGGADRLELTTALALGGLTPSLGTLIEVRRLLLLPTVVLIRPRSGGCAYSAADFRVMQVDIELALNHGADGLAFGVLTPEGGVDEPRCRQLVRQAGRCAAVFHRAFDVTPDPFRALEQLIDLGFTRVQTSGQEESAYNGAGRIAALIERAAGRIEILPAGGINRFTVADVVARTGCNQVHASLRARRADPSTAARPHVAFGTWPKPGENRYDVTDPEAVPEMARLLLQQTGAGRAS